MSLAIDPKLDLAQVSLDKSKQNGVLGAVPGELKDRSQIEKLSRDFEAIFVGIMLKSMRQAVPQSGFLDGGNAEDIYSSMLDAEYSSMMAEQSQAGLAKNIEEFLLRAANLDKNELPLVREASSANKAKGVAAYQAVAANSPTFSAETPAEKKLNAIVSRIDQVIKE